MKTKAYAIYEDGERRITVDVAWPKTWYSPLLHGPYDNLTAEAHAKIYELPDRHPEHPEFKFSGCVSASCEVDIGRRSGYHHAGNRGCF